MTSKGSSKIVAYYRVSTAKQGRSGLGLDAQKADVQKHAAETGGQIVAEFVEVESGKKDARPELAKAIEACRVRRATLVIAKLDRLSRSASFLFNLRDAGIKFIAADMPNANDMTIGVMALVAEQEAKAISERTTAALAAAKARGIRLGVKGSVNLKNRQLGSERGAVVRTAKADARAQNLAGTIGMLRERGAITLQELADALNAEGIETARGGKWAPTQVMRLLARLSADQQGSA